MIERHFKYSAANIEFAEKHIKKFNDISLSRMLGTMQAKQKGEMLSNGYNRSWEMFCKSQMIGLTVKESARYLKLSAQFAGLNFGFVNHAGETIEFDVEGHHISLMGAMKRDYVDDGSWMRSLWIVLMARNQEALQELLKTEEAIFDQAEIKPDQFSRAYSRLLKGVFQPEANLPELFQQAWQSFDPEVFEFARMEYIAENDLPAIKALRCLFMANGEAEYREAMKDAVLQHQAYWSSEEDDRDASDSGWISVPLTGLAALAYDHKGYTLDFETDYIPAWIAYKQFE